jgi:hypothetical protein
MGPIKLLLKVKRTHALKIKQNADKLMSIKLASHSHGKRLQSFQEESFSAWRFSKFKLFYQIFQRLLFKHLLLLVRI